MHFFSSPYFLRIYSGVLTFTFALTVGLGLVRGDFALHGVSAAARQGIRQANFDQITVHRIDVVEPDGTPRLILSDEAEFPGEFYRGREISRPDRRDSAGMLFLNDEGTENGGMLFGGYKSKDGAVHSFGHLSFDEYEQDQTLSQDTNQDGLERASSYQINDNNVTLLTPEVLSAYNKARSMPEGSEREKALAAVMTKYPLKVRPRASIERDPDKSAVLRLRDPEGRTRILLRVAPDGTPTMEFLDASGKSSRPWADAK